MQCEHAEVHEEEKKNALSEDSFAVLASVEQAGDSVVTEYVRLDFLEDVVGSEVAEETRKLLGVLSVLLGNVVDVQTTGTSLTEDLSNVGLDGDTESSALEGLHSQEVRHNKAGARDS